MMMFLVISLGIMGWIQGALAQEFPTKPITLLICMQPGAGADLGGSNHCTRSCEDFGPRDRSCE